MGNGTTYWYPTAFSVWGDEERHAMNLVQKSGRYTMGERTEEFEEAFAGYHGRRYGIMCNSGSSANLLMIAALCNLRDSEPLQRGEIACVPALAWSTTYAPLIQYGLQLRLMDCDDSWNANTIENQTTMPGWNAKPRLVVGCSILGNPANLDFLRAETMVGLGSYFIEDNCESFGAKLPRIDGVRRETGLCGSYGIMSSFSFFYSHQISAIEGGMVLTDNLEMARLCRVLRAHGWTRDIEEPQSFGTEYDFVAFGYNVRPLEMHAAIALVQLRKQETHKYTRQKNMALFRFMTKNLPIKHPTPYGEMNPFGLAFTLDDQEKRLDLVRAFRRNSIDCRLPTGGSFRLHRYGSDYRMQRTPHADRIHMSGMFLGNGPLDLSEQITRAVAVMKEVLT